MNENISIYSQLPNELIRHVFSYDNRFKHRNGRWMTQISKQDDRYSVLHTINRRIHTYERASYTSYVVVGNLIITIFWGLYSNSNWNKIDYYYKFFNTNTYEIYTLW